MEYKTLIITILISWGINFGFSQEQTRANIYFTIPEIATLDIEPNISDIIFNFNAPSEAGNPIETLSDNSKWLNYTSAITKGSVFRNITAQIDGIMPGIKILGDSPTTEDVYNASSITDQFQLDDTNA